MELKPSELLPPHALQPDHQIRHHLACWVDNDVTLEQILTPAFWRHHWKTFASFDQARNIMVGGIVEVMRRDMSLDVTLRVVRVETGAVHMRPLYPPFVDDSGIKARTASVEADAVSDLLEPAGYKVSYAPKGVEGKPPGYFAKLTVSGDIICAGKPSKREAIAEAIAHAKRSGTYTEPQPAAAA